MFYLAVVVGFVGFVLVWVVIEKIRIEKIKKEIADPKPKFEIGEKVREKMTLVPYIIVGINFNKKRGRYLYEIPVGNLPVAERVFTFDDRFYYRWIWEVELEKEIEDV